jgi:putative nucleotidyltransferase-like protein
VSVEPAVQSALAVMLPTPRQTLFLRACLCDGAAGTDAWRAWRAQVGHVKAAMGDDTSPVKRLLPLLYVALRRNGAEVDEGLVPYLKLAFAREQMRSKTFVRICGEVVDTLNGAAIEAIVLRGAAFSVSVYSDPARRHCHDIDLLVAGQDLGRAADALSRSGLANLHDPFLRESDAALRHDTGLPVRIHTRVFASRWYALPWDELWPRTEGAVIAEHAVRVLSPADALVHVLGHASYSVSRESLRWVCDCVTLIRRRRDLDWDAVVERAAHARCALPASVMLRYLREQLDADIPGAALERMDDAAGRAGVVARDVALFGAHSGSSGGVAGFLRRIAGGGRVRMRVAGWLLLPSGEYVERVVGVRGPLQRWLYYVTRPVAHAARALGRSR